MSKRYSKEFKQTIIDLFTQRKSARQLFLEYEVGYSTILKWIQGFKLIRHGGLTQDEI